MPISTTRKMCLILITQTITQIYRLPTKDSAKKMLRWQASKNMDLQWVNKTRKPSSNSSLQTSNARLLNTAKQSISTTANALLLITLKPSCAFSLSTTGTSLLDPRTKRSIFTQSMGKKSLLCADIMRPFVAFL
jgi:hypothetical protein